MRSQQSSGDPKLRYCASLGHKADDESGLVYMRARYYEPTSGRFISEDPAMDGQNWFWYCRNNPAAGADRTGRAFADAAAAGSPAAKAVDVIKTYSAVLRLFMAVENLETQ